jgi:glucose/arabinose dehydrogenase
VLGFDWHPTTGQMLFTDNGADHMGDLLPADEINLAPRPGLHFGFPYVYAPNGRYPEFQDRAPPNDPVPPVLELDAHVAPLGIDFY